MFFSGGRGSNQCSSSVGSHKGSRKSGGGGGGSDEESRRREGAAGSAPPISAGCGDAIDCARMQRSAVLQGFERTVVCVAHCNALPQCVVHSASGRGHKRDSKYSQVPLTAPARMLESDAAISLLATTRCAQCRRVTATVSPIEDTQAYPFRLPPSAPARVPLQCAKKPPCLALLRPSHRLGYA